MQVVPVEAAPLIGHVLVRGLIGAAVAGVSALIVYPFRWLVNSFKDVTTQLSGIQTELVHQRSNCLSTLQDQGTRQIELLEKTVGTLEAMHLDQRETLAIIRDRK